MNLEGDFSIIDGLTISIVSMLIIFAILIVISFMIDGFKLIFHEKEVKSEPVEKKSNTAEIGITSNEEELIAVISAAIQSYNEEQLDPENKLAIMAAEIRAKQIKAIDQLDIKRIKKLED